MYEDEIMKVLRGTTHSVRIPDLMNTVKNRIESFPVSPSLKFVENDFVDALDNLLDKGVLDLNWRNRVEIVEERVWVKI
jgi:hypothetical protein